MSDRDLFEALQRIATLEQKVADLYSRLGEAEPQWGAQESGFRGDREGGPSEDPQVHELLRRGNKIAAVKRYRELTGLGLREAKDVVDEIERRLTGR